MICSEYFSLLDVFSVYCFGQAVIIVTHVCVMILFVKVTSNPFAIIKYPLVRIRKYMSGASMKLMAHIGYK